MEKCKLGTFFQFPLHLDNKDPLQYKYSTPKHQFLLMIFSPSDLLVYIQAS